eukprot:3298691-Rhodomonas_salina.2
MPSVPLPGLRAYPVAPRSQEQPKNHSFASESVLIGTLDIRSLIPKADTLDLKSQTGNRTSSRCP